MCKVKCAKCKGTGIVNCYRHVDAGVCYDCKGVGFLLRKTKPVEMIRFHVTAIVKEGYQNTGKRIGVFVNAKNEKEATRKARLDPECYDINTIQATPA